MFRRRENYEESGFRAGAQPLYMQLKEIIRQDIENGVYARHETIPAEIVFQNQYGVS